MNGSQSLAMMNDLHNTVTPLYAVPPAAVPVVTTVVPTAVHTSYSSSSNAYAHRAPPGAFIIHTSQGPMVSFPVDAYPGWNSALNVGYPNPASTLPTSVVGGLTTNTVHSASALSSTVPTISLLPSLTDIATATITTATAAVTNSVVVDSVSSKLATGLEFLALNPRPFGVETHPSKQALPVPVAAPPTALPCAATTPATDQLPGNATTATAAEPASAAATVAASVASPVSTMTSSAVLTTSTTTAAASTVLPMSTTVTPDIVTSFPITTSTVASSSSSTGVAVVGFSGSNPPGSTYIAPTQSVTPPVVVVYSQNVLKRYDGFSSPKEYMEHFDIIADVNGWKTELDKLKYLKAALDGRAAYQIKDLDKADSAKAFAALRKRLLSHFGSLNEIKSAVRQFRRRLQAEGEAIDEYADALLKLHRAGWPCLTSEQRDAEL